MSFIGRLAAILFPPQPQGPSEYEAARLERVRDEQRWRQYDEPAARRKERALNGERQRKRA